MEGFVTNLDIFMFVKGTNSISEPDVLIEKIISIIGPNNINEEETKQLKIFCRTHMSYLQRKWVSSNRTVLNFIKRYGKWLEQNVKWPQFLHDKLPTHILTQDENDRASVYSFKINEGASTSESSPSTVDVGTSVSPICPRKPFAELSPLQKRRRVGENIMTENPEHLAYATMMNCGNKDVADIIKYVLENPDKAADIKKMIKGQESQISFAKYSPDKALGILISLDLSKWQYKTLRMCSIQEGLDLYPSYKDVLAAKKSCYPPDVTVEVTETGVKVNLQDILDVTVKRLAMLIDSEALGPKELTLICKWGFDGASGQSNYKQTMDEGDDSSVFMCSFVPLRLVCGENVIWKNPKPSSTFYCRPIYFKFENENKLNIKEEMSQVQAEIEKLVPTSLGNNVKVKHMMLMTMIDGKISSHLTETSMQTCDICKALPREMNDLEKIDLKPARTEMYQYGLSTLHAKIRCMECMLHIAYRLDFKKWKVWECNKEAFKIRKQDIHDKFKRYGIILDVVKQGAGTTNDGNTARRFFEDPQRTADITGLNIELIKRFSLILRAVSSGEKINIEMFSKYTRDTAELYIELYSWYYMPSSVHKLLIHGADIIAHFKFIPIGHLSEEASEARNKDFRKLRENHSRKMDRKKTNEDIFHGLIISSDPYLSSVRPSLRHKKAEAEDDLKCLLEISSSLNEPDTEEIEFINVDDFELNDE